MAIYMTLEKSDIDGYQRPIGFYHSDITSDIPNDAIEISHKQFEELSGKQNNVRWHSGQVVKYVLPLGTAILSRQKSLNHSLAAYIYGVYDAGTQASMQAIWSQDATPAAVKSDIEAVWAWIASIMTYYYQCKSELAALTDAEAVASYTWDFSQFDTAVPEVTLQGIFAAI